MRSPDACPDEHALLRHCEGSLGGTERDAVAAHLRRCEACAAVFEALRPDDPTPAQIGRFQVQHRLGAGAMGVVYAARDPKLDREVALKVVATAAAGRDAISRMRREARAMAKIAHPHVVPVYDVGPLSQGLFIAMELIDGPTLTTWLRDRTRPWRDVLALMRRAGLGLAAAHEVGVVHRDFKPDNVLVAAGDHPMVADFGLASANRASPTTQSENSLRSDVALEDGLTGTDALIGTPSYMAPEQFGGHADARSDQFSFCVALYEALYGTPPFAGQSLFERISEVTEGRVIRPTRSHGVPRRVWRVIQRGLSSDPGERWPDMHAIVDALRPPSGRRWSLAVAGVSALPLLSAAAPARSSPPDDPTPLSLAESWNAQSRASLRETFTATGHPDAVASFERVAAALDRYAVTWDVERARANPIGPDDRPSRLRCLRRHHDRFAALLDVLSLIGDDAVDRAPGVASTLPTPRGCGDGAHETDTIVAPGVEARARPIERKLEQANMTYQVGDPPGAHALSGEALHDARELGYGPLIVEALVVRAHMDVVAGRMVEATALYEEMYFVALEHALPSRAVHAAGTLVTLNARELLDFAAAQTWRRHGRAVLERHPLPRSAELTGEARDFISHEGEFALVRGDFDEAIRLLTQAADDGDAAEEGERKIVWRRNLLADALRMSGREADAIPQYRRTVSLQRAYLAPGHPALLWTTTHLLSLLAHSGDPDAPAEAEPMLADAVAAVRTGLSTPPDVTASLLSHLSIASRRLGQLDEALTLRLRALEVDEAASRRYQLQGYCQLGLIFAGMGRWADAADAYAAALARIPAHGAPPGVADAVRCRLARAEFALGDHAAARSHAEACPKDAPRIAAAAAETAQDGRGDGDG